MARSRVRSDITPARRRAFAMLMAFPPWTVRRSNITAPVVDAPPHFECRGYVYWQVAAWLSKHGYTTERGRGFIHLTGDGLARARDLGLDMYTAAEELGL